jgi:hypothetical protein
MKRQYEEDEDENKTAGHDIRGERRIKAKRAKQTHDTDTAPATHLPSAPIVSTPIQQPQSTEIIQPPAQQLDGQSKSSLAILQPVIDILEMDKTAIGKIRQVLPLLPLATFRIDQLHGIIVYAHIFTAKTVGAAPDSSEFIQFACKLFMEVKKIHYAKSETYNVFPSFLAGCLHTAHCIFKMTSYPRLEEAGQLFGACMDTIKASCSLYFEFQRMFIILVKDTLDSQDKQESLFNRHLYKYSWMLVIFAIGRPHF